MSEGAHGNRARTGEHSREAVLRWVAGPFRNTASPTFPSLRIRQDPKPAFTFQVTKKEDLPTPFQRRSSKPAVGEPKAAATIKRVIIVTGLAAKFETRRDPR